jgi:hypothetical protein
MILQCGREELDENIGTFFLFSVAATSLDTLTFSRNVGMVIKHGSRYK